MDQTNTKLSPIKEIYCINCHEELILDAAEKKGEKDIVCPKCDTSFNLLDEHNFLKNLSPIVEGLCPSCWEELVFDIEDRINKGKIECPVCKDSFYMEEVLYPSNKVTKKKERRAEGLKREKRKKIKEIGKSAGNTAPLESGKITSKGGIVFSTSTDDLDRKCKSCGREYDPENDFYCSSCGSSTFQVPTSKEISFLYDAPEELTERPSLVYSEFLLKELIPKVSETILPNNYFNPASYPFLSRDFYHKNILEIRLCNSAILYGFAIRVAEEIFWDEKKYDLPQNYNKKIKTVVKKYKFEKRLPTNWEEQPLIEPLKGMLLSNYFSYYGFQDYFLDIDFVKSALYKAITFDSELQGAYLDYYDDESIKQRSITMIRTGYTLGMQLSIKGDDNRELGTKSLLSENYRKLLKK